MTEAFMITLTENARKELEAYFADKEKGTIRVFLAPGGCSGPSLALALDTPNADDDSVFDVDGFSFCINKELLNQIEAATIDLSYMGFVIEARVPLPQQGDCSCSGCGSGGCGSSSSCGG